MKSDIFRGLAGCALILATIGTSIPDGASAQSGRDIQMPPQFDSGDAGLSLTVGTVSSQMSAAPAGRTLRVGQLIRICTTAGREGFVSIWSRTLDQTHLERLYPNKHDPAVQDLLAAPLEAGVPLCIGDSENFQLRVVEPVGPAEIFVSWTDKMEKQFGENDIVRIGQGALPPAQCRTGCATETVGYVTAR